MLAAGLYSGLSFKSVQRRACLMMPLSIYTTRDIEEGHVRKLACEQLLVPTTSITFPAPGIPLILYNAPPATAQSRSSDALPTASTDGDGAGCCGLIGCWLGWALPLSAGRSATHFACMLRVVPGPVPVPVTCTCYLYLYLYLMHRGCGGTRWVLGADTG